MSPLHTGADRPGPKPSGKRGALIVGLVVVAVCAGLCGVGQLITVIVNQDDWEGRGTPVPASTYATPTPSWHPPNELVDPQPVLQIRHQLERWVLISAGVSSAVTSSCDDPDFTGEHAAVLSCTVTYQRHDVVYSVTARPDGDLVEWQGEAEKTVVTRDGLLALLYHRFGEHSDWENLRCEDLPELSLAPVGEPLEPVCYATMDGRIKTSRIEILPNDTGEPSLNVVHQEEGLR